MPGLNKILTLVFLISAVIFTQAQEISTDPAIIKQGDDLFKANCKSCHRVKEKLVGPALAGVDTRVPSIDWIKDWVRNSAKFSESERFSNIVCARANFPDSKRSPKTSFSFVISSPRHALNRSTGTCP